MTSKYKSCQERYWHRERDDWHNGTASRNIVAIPVANGNSKCQVTQTTSTEGLYMLRMRGATATVQYSLARSLTMTGSRRIYIDNP